MKLVQARMDRGLSMQRVAFFSGLSVTQYGRLERGQAGDPHHATVVRICRALGVEPETVDEFQVPEYDPMAG